MKQQVFYIHGGMSFSNNDDYLQYLQTTPIKPHAGERPKRWADSLAEDLGEEYEVFSPTMPNKYNAKYEEWKIWFERHFEFLHDGVILIGWSQGGMFLARYLTENTPPFTVKALFLLAAPYERFEINGEDGGYFYPQSKLVPNLPQKAGQVFVVHSEDDFVVPYSHAELYKEAVPGAELVTFTDKNHFLIEEFPELLEHIRSID